MFYFYQFPPRALLWLAGGRYFGEGEGRAGVDGRASNRVDVCSFNCGGVFFCFLRASVPLNIGFV